MLIAKILRSQLPYVPSDISTWQSIFGIVISPFYKTASSCYPTVLIVKHIREPVATPRPVPRLVPYIWHSLESCL